MIDDNHLETQTDTEAVATQTNPKKGLSGPLTDAMCLANICLITAVTVRCRETTGLLASVRRLICQFDAEGKKPSTILFDRGYSTMAVIVVLHAEGVYVLGTARDFEKNINKHGPFLIRDNKHGPTVQ